MFSYKKLAEEKDYDIEILKSIKEQFSKDLERETSQRANFEYLTKKEQEKLKSKDQEIVLKDQFIKTHSNKITELDNQNTKQKLRINFLERLLESN